MADVIDEVELLRLVREARGFHERNSGDDHDADTCLYCQGVAHGMRYVWTQMDVDGLRSRVAGLEDWTKRSKEREDRLEKLLQRLVEQGPPTETVTRCALCDNETSAHERDCPWRMANEYLNPEAYYDEDYR